MATIKYSILILIMAISFSCCNVVEQSNDEYYLEYILKMNEKQGVLPIKTTEWTQFCRDIAKLHYTYEKVETMPTPQEALDNVGINCVGYAILSRAVISHKFIRYIICYNDDTAHVIALYEDDKGFYVTNCQYTERLNAEMDYINLKSLAKFDRFVSEKNKFDRRD